MEECVFGCIRNDGINNWKGRFILLGVFLGHCGWIWYSKLEVYPLGEALGAECGSKIGSYNGITDDIGDGKLEVYKLG